MLMFLKAPMPTPSKKKIRTQAPKPLRRSPSQDRAQSTVEALLQATAQILQKEGEAALTTNHVAEVAGYSIGTLYQYFPNKDSLIQGVGARVQAMLLQQTERQLQTLGQDPLLHQQNPQQLVHRMVEMIVQTLTLNGKNKQLVRLYWRLEQPEQTEATVKSMSDLLSSYLVQQRHPGLCTPNSAQMFVLTRAVLGVIRSASLEGSPLLGSTTLVDGISQMVCPLLTHTPR